MIFKIEKDGKLEYPITFDQLRERFPNTSFCMPIVETALPEGYHLAEVHSSDPLNPMPKPEKDKKLIQGRPFKTESGWKYETISAEVTEEELEEAKSEVDKKVMNGLESIGWAFSDPELPPSLIDKYKQKKKHLLAVYEQDGYPFHVKYPEVE